jgi:hypothetical protein
MLNLLDTLFAILAQRETSVGTCEPIPGASVN